ncbi:MAG: hypothetical protein ABIS26_02655 [Candidatus Paceibacterota bacterium]
MNVVTDAAPRWDDAQHLHIKTTLDSLKKMPANRHQAFLESEWPTLANDVVARLALKKRLPGGRADSVVYRYGSGNGIRADDAKGQINEGYFEDELVAYVYAGNTSPTRVIVRCLNGIYEIEGSDLNLERSFAVTPTTRFTVAKGKGLNAYVSFLTSVELARAFDLQVSRGKYNQPKTKISFDEARQLADSLRQVGVRVKVYPGDQFDLAAGTYTPVHGKVRQAKM